MAEEEKKENEEAENQEEALSDEELEQLELDQIELTEEEIGEKSEEEILEFKRGMIAAKKKKKKKKKLLIIILVLAIIGGGAGAFFGGLLGGGSEHISLDENDPLADAVGEDGKKIKTVFMDLPDMVVNLSSNSRRPNFINLKLTLELKSAEDVVLIEEQLPRIIDAFNTYLREMRREDLQGSAGLYRLEHELMLRLQKTLIEGEVVDILFREIIIQ